MSPRKRRGVLLLGLAFIGAIAVFAAVSSYVSDVRKDVTPKTTVYVLDRAVEAQTPIVPSMLRAKSIPVRFVSSQAIRDPALIASRVAGQPIPAGAELSEGMLVDPPTVERGQRELAVNISADTGVAGKIVPGDLVDIQAAYAGDQRSLPRARTIITRARIVSIGTPQTPTAQRNFAGDDASNASLGSGGGAGGAVVPVTFALSPRNVLIAEHAQNFAQEIRLALLPPGDTTRIRSDRREYTLPPTKARAPR